MRSILASAALLLAVVSGDVLSQAQMAAEREADHAALRALLVKGAEALNTRNFDAIAPSLHPSLTVITVDARKHVGVDAFKKYFLGLFEGPGAILDDFTARPEADDLTFFVEDNTGLTYGMSEETYRFKDGDVRTMRTRWSALTRKDAGVWKLVNVHFSANVVDNPVLDAMQGFATKLAVAALILGLVVGAGAMWLVRRRRAG